MRHIVVSFSTNCLLLSSPILTLKNCLGNEDTIKILPTFNNKNNTNNNNTATILLYKIKKNKTQNNKRLRKFQRKQPTDKKM